VTITFPFFAAAGGSWKSPTGRTAPPSTGAAPAASRRSIAGRLPSLMDHADLRSPRIYAPVGW